MAVGSAKARDSKSSSHIPTNTPADVPASRSRGSAGVLQRLPRRFEEQALLGVEAVGLAGGDAEELGVQPVDVGEEAAPAGRDVAGRPRALGVEGVGVEAIARDGPDGVEPLAEQTPERAGTVGSAR